MWSDNQVFFVVYFYIKSVLWMLAHFKKCLSLCKQAAAWTAQEELFELHMEFWITTLSSSIIDLFLFNSCTMLSSNSLHVLCLFWTQQNRKWITLNATNLFIQRLFFSESVGWNLFSLKPAFTVNIFKCTQSCSTMYCRERLGNERK